MIPPTTGPTILLSCSAGVDSVTVKEEYIDEILTLLSYIIAIKDHTTGIYGIKITKSKRNI